MKTAWIFTAWFLCLLCTY